MYHRWPQSQTLNTPTVEELSVVVVFSCLNEFVCILVLLCELHLLSSQFGLQVIHLSEGGRRRRRGGDED